MRWLTVLLSMTALLLPTAEAGAQYPAQYPDRPVRITVPFIAGSAPDVAARNVAQRLTMALGQAQQGGLRALAVTNAKRTRAMPEVPTLLQAVLVEALKDPVFREQLDGDGSQIVLDTPAEFASVLNSESARWHDLVARVGVKID